MAEIRQSQDRQRLLVEDSHDKAQTLVGPDSKTVSRENSVFFDSVMNRMNPRSKARNDVLAQSKRKPTISKDKT